MSVDIKCQQVIWAYIILDALTLATTKLIEVPHKNYGYKVKEEVPPSMPEIIRNIDSDPVYSKGALLNSDVSGILISQPSNIQELIAQPQKPSNLTRKPYGLSDLNLKESTLNTSGKYIQRKPLRSPIDAEPKATTVLHGTNKYLTPEFVKFKEDIDEETTKHHTEVLHKLRKEPAPSSNVVYGKPYKKPERNYSNSKNKIIQESHRKPYIYDGLPDETAPYAKPVSYQQYSSISNDPPYYSAESTYYDPPSQTPYSSDSYSYPSYPPLPPIQPEPFSSLPYSELGSKHHHYPTDTHYDPPYIPPTSSQNYQNYQNENSPAPVKPVEESEEESPAVEQEDEFDREFRSSDESENRPSKKDRTNHDEDDEYSSDPTETYRRTKAKPVRKSKNKHREPASSNKFGIPYGDPAPVPLSAEEDADFEQYESSPDSFLDGTGENLEDEDEDEEVAPKSSKQSTKSTRPSKHRKRCVKKHKEMSVEDISSGNFEEEAGKEMTCLVCENLDTGGTYETCSYESEPKKNKFYAGNASSYRTGVSNPPYKYRMRRHITTIINNTEPIKRVIRRTYNEDSGGSYTADPDDFGPEHFSDKDDDDHEEQQDESDDDEFEEYKPSPPAYANEHACTEVIKNGATCMVCHNPETNGKYEQCSYASDPENNSYEFSKSARYGNKGEEPDSGRYRRNLGFRKGRLLHEKSHYDNDKREPIEDDASSEPVESDNPEIKDMTKIYPNNWKNLRKVEQQKIDSINNNFRELVRTKKEQPNDRLLEAVENPSYEEQFLNLFPELSGGSAGEPVKSGSLLSQMDDSLLAELPSKDEHIPGFDSKRKLKGYFKNSPKKSILNEEDDGEMSKMMKEFKTKDRSACKKTFKNKMTCYVCNDEDGMKREECMYVVESEPTKASYHESSSNELPRVVKNSRKREIENKPSAQSLKYKHIPLQEEPETAHTEQLLPPLGPTKHRFPIDAAEYKKSSNPDNKSYSNVKIRTEELFSTNGAPAKITRKRLPKVVDDSDMKASVTRSKKIGETDARRDEDSNLEEPDETGEYSAVEVVPEADPSSPDGAFSDETVPTYDPELRVSLPKYMVEKSEHERIVDKFMRLM